MLSILVSQIPWDRNHGGGTPWGILEFQVDKVEPYCGELATARIACRQRPSKVPPGLGKITITYVQCT